MSKNIGVKLASFFGQGIITFLRAMIVGGITVTFLILNLDNFTDSKYGVNNLVIISSSFVFFPTFFILLVELFFLNIRKNQRNARMQEEQYTKSDL